MDHTCNVDSSVHVRVEALMKRRNEAERIKYNAYMKEYHKKQYYRVKAGWIYQLGGKCVICGSTAELEIDHRDRSDKLFEISKMWAYSSTKIAVELAKCQLLCATCHNEKSIVELGKQVVKCNDVHGTVSSYRYCKCDLCKAAKNAYNKNYKMRDPNYRSRQPWKHGTRTGYSYHKCRCELCTEANRMSAVKYKIGLKVRP